jgi:protein-(glutamine-N5) methyltransferase, release factor-specific
VKIKEVIELGKQVLIRNNIDDASLVARELLAHVLGQNKQYLVIHSNDELKEEYRSKFVDCINQIVSGKPLQYITNKQEFMGLNFFVDENVLIPQPDTEVLVEETIKKCISVAELGAEQSPIKILDLCTGSGAIAISLNYVLAQKNINAEIMASDISAKALDIAKKNNESNNTSVKFAESNLFENIQKNDFDIIVSNPPYIKRKIIETLPCQVQAEPHIALDGGEDGLDFYKKIIDQACKYIKNGYVLLEIGYDQKDEVEGLFRANGRYSEIETVKDLSNNDRCVIARVK